MSATKSHDNAFPHGMQLVRDPLLNKGTAFTDAERDAFGLRGLLPPHVNTQAEQVQRVLENFHREVGSAGSLHQSRRAARPQRDAVLSPAGRLPGRDDAGGLHADGRPRLPALRPHLPAAAGAVHRHPRPGPDRQRAAQLAQPRRGDDRRHRRRAHPRPGRPRRQRHGHPGGQARALYRRRRRASGAVPADRPRRRHQQRRNCRTTRCTSASSIPG